MKLYAVQKPHGWVVALDPQDLWPHPASRTYATKAEAEAHITAHMRPERRSSMPRKRTSKSPSKSPERKPVKRNDRRELMAMIKAFPDGAEIDENAMTVFFELDQDEGEPIDCVLPISFGVCGTCEGKGRHVNPAIDSHGITASEWEEDYDDEARETYMSGGYDVQCSECAGQRVVPEIDESRADKKCLDAYRAWQKNEYESATERAYQQRMGY